MRQTELKEIIIPLSNISDGAAFILKGAQRRRLAAMAGVRQVNTSAGADLKLVSAK